MTKLSFNKPLGGRLTDASAVALLNVLHLLNTKVHEGHRQDLAVQIVVRDRSQFELHFQRQGGRYQGSRTPAGVRYVLEGSVRKASGKVRITGQLIDAITGAHFDLTDVFALQDDVTVSVVSAIQPKLFQTEIGLATRRRTENLTAYVFFSARCSSTTWPLPLV